ncbi:nitrile-specifier protein 5 isoform X2 [Myripristis murdjan]|uniref:nitrile-specifier protein 5 isoform X2 n=1 Tax=Myripristis murdjan TaxID=586833 RepID=UPI0011763CBB|nr:nitrile-specifier protein 5-like isoform X2 [Myripristis murdjan]
MSFGPYATPPVSLSANPTEGAFKFTSHCLCLNSCLSLASENGNAVRAQSQSRCWSVKRCLIWEGDWAPDIVTEAAEKGRRGVYGKIVLTVCGQPKDKTSFISSTPLVQRKRLFPEQHSTATDLSHLSHTLHQSTGSEKITPNSSHFGDSVCYAELHADKTETHDSTLGNKHPVWPTEKTPKRTIIGKRGHLTWSSEDMDNLTEELEKPLSPKKVKLSRMNSREEKIAQINSECRAVCPSKRWSHALCLSDPDTAILIGGETSDQNYCKDSAWKLEIDNDFWFPMTSSTSEPIPPCACGHSATYDPDSKAVFVYGGLREGQRYNELYILDTLAWKWRLVTAKGNVPNLAYHSAVVYKKELYIFGGVQPSRSPVDQTCSNALYIFNPEFELWYQPIVEGEKPLSRFGHSATLLSDKLLIFGGRKTATYLNDLHMLDLGFMEYTAVKCDNMPPLPRGFHAALPVSENRMLISGGCSAVGALQDVHIFNVDTNMWSSLVCPLLCSKPRAGHSIINLDYSSLANIQSQKQGKHGNIQCTLLVFGGSDCSGTFYNDTIKCKVEIPGDK